jgi:hypothetical protein
MKRSGFKKTPTERQHSGIAYDKCVGLRFKARARAQELFYLVKSLIAGHAVEGGVYSPFAFFAIRNAILELLN